MTAASAEATALFRYRVIAEASSAPCGSSYPLGRQRRSAPFCTPAIAVASPSGPFASIFSAVGCRVPP